MELIIYGVDYIWRRMLTFVCMVHLGEWKADDPAARKSREIKICYGLQVWSDM